MFDPLDRVKQQRRKEAGLDYRKTLIINNIAYISQPEYCNISSSQQRILEVNYDKIVKQVISYIEGYKRAVIKKRHRFDNKLNFLHYIIFIKN